MKGWSVLAILLGASSASRDTRPQNLRVRERSSASATDTPAGALNVEGGRRLRRSRIRSRSIGEMGMPSICKICKVRRRQSLTGPERACVRCARELGLLAPVRPRGRKPGTLAQPWHVRHFIDDSLAKRVQVVPPEPREFVYRHVTYEIVWDGTHGRVAP